MTKRLFAVVIAIAMVCTMFAFVTSAAETTTVNLDSSVTAHGWNQILNAINFNDYDNDEDGWKQVAEAQNLRAILLYGTTLDGWAVNTEEPWNSVLYLKCKVADLIAEGIAWNGEAPAADVLVCDYMQNTFGYVAYALRGGKQRALDLWNTYFPGQEATLVGDTAFTYYNNTKYTDASFNAALACLKAYMTYAQDNQVCNVGTTGRWTAQKARYASLENALNALEAGTPEVVPTTTVTLNTASNYTWYGYLNVVNVIPETENEGLRAAGTPYKVFLTEMLAIMNDPNAGASSDAAYMNSHAMSDGTLLKDYVQDTYGAYAYVLRGGRQKAADYWNSKLSVALTLGNNSYTYTNAGTQTAYDATAYQAAVDALNDYMANTGDASCFDVENGGGRFFDQRTKYNALVAAVDALPQAAGPVDFSDVVTSEPSIDVLVMFYENIDVESYLMLDEVQTWARAIYDGLKAGLTTAAQIVYDGHDVTWHWENVIRYKVLLSDGAKTAADAVMNDDTLWPGGIAITDQNQTTYKADQYQEVYDLWVLIRDTYRADYMNTTTSMVVNKCEELRTKIQALEVVSLKFTPEQKEAYNVLKTYTPYYRARIERILLDSNKATAIYKNFVALVERAEGYIALDWVAGTSESYPSVEEMHALIMPEAMGGQMEVDWYPFREAFGLDNAGYDTLVGNTYNEWLASGLYTEESLAQVKSDIDNFTYATLNNSRGPHNTDEMVQNDIAILKSLLVEIPKPTLPAFKIASANLTLSDSIAVNFKVKAEVYEAYENVYAVISCGTNTITINNPVYKEAEGLYVFSFTGIGPQKMKDSISCTLYGTANGQGYTKTVEYSVYKYCTNQLAKSNDPAFKAVVTDLLNYGAAAQVYANYKTDDLVNAGIDQTYASATLADPVNQLNTKLVEIENPTVAWKGASLYLESRVNARLTFEAADLTGLTVKFVIDGVESVTDKFEPVPNKENRYYAYFDNLTPAQMRTAFTATVYKDGVAVSNTLQYSIQSYVVGKTTAGVALNDMLVAMLKYADSCKVCFG